MEKRKYVVRQCKCEKRDIHLPIPQTNVVCSSLLCINCLQLAEIIEVGEEDAGYNQTPLMRKKDGVWVKVGEEKC